MLRKREINLIPPDVILREHVQKRIWMWSGIIVLVIMFLAGMYVYEQREISAVNEAIAHLSIKKNEIEDMMKQVKILQEKRDRLARKERVINMLLHKRSISLLFAELERDMNENVWLTSFEFKDPSSAANTTGEGQNDDDWVETGYFIVRKNNKAKKKDAENERPVVTAELRGMALSNKDLARFLEKLSASNMFSDVNLQYSREDTSGDGGLVEFAIETKLKDMRRA
ncbi:MAG: PilN domain-containing protein [Nitrospiraceae bacterium]|nr:MAG: PilN domain-containing protein [Nitrospiraceae bacterium]